MRSPEVRCVLAHARNLRQSVRSFAVLAFVCCHCFQWIEVPLVGDEASQMKDFDAAQADNIGRKVAQIGRYDAVGRGESSTAVSGL